MVFHAPFPISSNADRASAIRPFKMLKAFQDLGFDVHQVTGHRSERKESFRELRLKVAEGWVPDFCYSEAATIPSSFTEPKHFPLTLNLERDFFRFLKTAGVPSGVV